ncbi:MAG TPA: hypothetical protein VHB77_11695, partial [Planctomycetaceae bacterium]|nr:hypothetical protein [Planctomycetaceae bacterium]
MKKLHWSLFVACALLCSAAPLAAQSKDSDKDKSDKSSQQDKSNQPGKSSQNQDQNAYLGVAIEPVHHSMARHMGEKLKNGQGLIVVDVHEDSP